MNGVSHKVCGGVENDAGVGVRVDTANDVNGIGGETQIMHDPVELGMGDGVKSTGKIDIKCINVFVRGPGIFEDVCKAL